MNGSLLLLLDALRDAWGGPDTKFIIHAGYAASGHSESSRHYTGDAVDFHIEDGEPYPLQIAVMNDSLRRFQVSDRVGLGIYPCWHRPGFHLDLRPARARWGHVPALGGYISWPAAIDYASRKFKDKGYSGV